VDNRRVPTDRDIRELTDGMRPPVAEHRAAMRASLVLSRAAILAGTAALAFGLAGCGGSSTTTVTVTVTTAPTSTGQSAEANAAVIELQQVMTDLGYYDGPIDGVYGAATTEAVKTMQKDLGVTDDGIYGPATHDALKGKGKSIVMELQTGLTTYGYYDGPIDGDYGQATQEAIKKLQTDLGVTVDGQLGPETAQAFAKAVADGTVKPK
jgi:peptidoglycan hydrolase-like protein with peptidoglycan-binding domain